MDNLLNNIMKDCSILIGNTDNNLTQTDWSKYCYEVRRYLIEEIQTALIHFVGGTNIDSPYQSFCITFSIEEKLIPELKIAMCEIRKKYNQDSLAFLIGTTEFI